MNRIPLIEKLKSNERAFGLCSEEERTCFKEVGPDNCLYYSRDLDWRQAWCFNPTGAICIKPDYAPTPKEKKREVYEADTDNGMRLFFKSPSCEAIGLALEAAVRLPNFIAFQYANGERDMLPRRIRGACHNPAQIPKYVVLAEE